MELITLNNYQSIVLGSGYILYLRTNHSLYVLTYVNGDEIHMRQLLYGLGNYGTEMITTRRALVGTAIVYGGWG